MFVTCSGITKHYQQHKVLDSITFSLEQGEIVSLIGPSGTGKSTLLRCIAGLEPVSDGSIILDGQDITCAAAEKRPVVMMFQQPLLFPHMTIMENITYGLKIRKVSKNEYIRMGHQMLERIELGSYGNRYPYELSGGQQQRIALARALIIKPKLLLLDEPFSSLDPELRATMRDWVKGVLKKEQITAIFVTHDKEEAMIMGDRIGIINALRLEQIGHAVEVYRNPSTPFVAEFFSNGIVIDDKRFVHTENLLVEAARPISSKEELCWQGTITSRFNKHGQWFDTISIKINGGVKDLVIAANQSIALNGQVIIKAFKDNVYEFEMRDNKCLIPTQDIMCNQ